MASLIPIDGDMFQRLREQKNRSRVVHAVDKSPTLGEYMALGQLGAQAVGGLGNAVIQGVGNMQAKGAWDEANQKYHDEQKVQTDCGCHDQCQELTCVGIIRLPTFDGA